MKSNKQLLANIIRGKEAELIAEKLLAQSDDSFKKLERILDDLTDIHGLGEIKITSIKSALEMGRRYRMQVAEETKSMEQPVSIARHMMPLFEGKAHEEVWIVCLDTKNKITSKKMIYKGTLNECVLHPREIFRYAILQSAASIAIVHNHPSGSVEPGRKDEQMTRRLRDAGEQIRIPLLDHLIIGDNTFFSFKDVNLI